MSIKNSCIAIALVFCFSCKKESATTTKQQDTVVLNELDYVIHSSFPEGDVRRYGVYPDSIINQNYLKAVTKLAASGIKITFPKGFYNTDLFLRGITDADFYFNDASFAGQIQITEAQDSTESDNIRLGGKLTTYSKFFTRRSQNIELDTLIVKSDTLKNNLGRRSLGCNIYAGTKHIKMKQLIVEDLGSGHDYYTYSLAALQIHGWNNNPEDVIIDEVIIEGSDRHGVYITGNNHVIRKLTINEVGLGTTEITNGLEDADVNELKNISALWINKCQKSKFYDIVIDCEKSKANVTVNFDEGKSGEPTIIDSLKILNNKNSINMLPNDLTNVVVRHFEEFNE